ncbi:hypothetical protein FACS1894208_04110 [Clostridia bacterium]|nr:hypothetical protein FACS1894208_04110 [Clostridia bacterium]
MGNFFAHISQTERLQIESYVLKEKKRAPEIAERRYRANLASKGPSLKIGNHITFANFIESRIVNHGDSPAAALARARQKSEFLGFSICVSTLYAYIDKGIFLRLANKHLPEREKRPEEIRAQRTCGH